ncbi:hypothetical protein D3C87_255460 [compost metagenome]
METKLLFEEKQYFRQWWLLALLLGLFGFAMYGLVTQVFMGIIFGDKPMSNEGLILFALLQFVLTIFFFMQSLTTRIDDNGIHIKFWPYHRRWKFYPWEEIVSCEVKVYSPIMDYGGWGLRAGAYNVAGNVGMLLKFKSRPNLMIGTQKPDELKKALEKLGKFKIE